MKNDEGDTVSSEDETPQEEPAVSNKIEGMARTREAVAGEKIRVINKQDLVAFIETHVKGIQGGQLLSLYSEIKKLEKQVEDERAAQEVLEKEVQVLIIERGQLETAKEEASTQNAQHLETIAKLEADLAHAQSEVEAACARLAEELRETQQSLAEERAEKEHMRSLLGVGEGRQRDLEEQVENARRDVKRMEDRIQLAEQGELDKLAYIQELEEKLELLRRETTYATLMRDPDPEGYQERINKAKEALESHPRADMIEAELTRLENWAKKTGSHHSTLVDAMNNRRGTIEVIAQLAEMSAHDKDEGRFLGFLESLLENADRVGD